MRISLNYTVKTQINYTGGARGTIGPSKKLNFDFGFQNQNHLFTQMYFIFYTIVITIFSFAIGYCQGVQSNRETR